MSAARGRGESLMHARTDFDEHELYRAVREMAGFIYDLEDRFPEDEMALLFHRLKATSVDVGALVAEGFGRAGSGAAVLDDVTQRDIRARLNTLRHYFLISRDRFILDENHEREFQARYDRIQDALAMEGADA